MEMFNMANYKNPVLQSGEHQITSPFGMRTHPVTGVANTLHTGVDFVRTGGKLDYIVAFADGKVTNSKYSSNGGGEFIQIDHGNGQYTRYLHLKKGSRAVKVGETVKKGQVLGYMGATGNVTGAHLHFDINIDGNYVDPIPYLEGKKELEGAKYKMETLKLGSKGNDVTIFESIMKKMGYYNGEIDTTFGSGCVSACNKFQTAYPECGTNGKPDGMFGAKCWKKALSLLG
jgi:hypothetical protein